MFDVFGILEPGFDHRITQVGINGILHEPRNAVSAA